jgi:hypothetical protein
MVAEPDETTTDSRDSAVANLKKCNSEGGESDLGE